MSIKDRKRKAIDRFELGIAEPVFNGVIGIILKGFNKGVSILIRISAYVMLTDKNKRRKSGYFSNHSVSNSKSI